MYLKCDLYVCWLNYVYNVPLPLHHEQAAPGRWNARHLECMALSYTIQLKKRGGGGMFVVKLRVFHT